jgi:hypothetical protein
VKGKIEQFAVHVLAGSAAWGMRHLLGRRFLEEPTDRGLAGDAKEALLRAGTAMVATFAASLIVRRLL